MIQDPHQEMDVIPEPKQPFLKVLYRTSILVVWSNCTRTLLYIVFTILLALCSLIVLVSSLQRAESAMATIWYIFFLS